MFPIWQGKKVISSLMPWHCNIDHVQTLPSLAALNSLHSLLRFQLPSVVTFIIFFHFTPNLRCTNLLLPISLPQFRTFHWLHGWQLFCELKICGDTSNENDYNSQWVPRKNIWSPLLYFSTEDTDSQWYSQNVSQ